MCRFYFFYSVEQKILVDKGLIDDFAVFTKVGVIIVIFSGLLYPILAYIKLIKFRRLLDDNFSFDGRISLDWLKYCIQGIGILFLTVAVVTILTEGMNIEFPFNVDYIFYSIIILFVFCIGFFGIRQQHLFSVNGIDNNTQFVHEKSTVDYKKSGLKSESAKEIHHRLKHIMTQEKPFTNPQLTLADLAQNADVSVNHLSQVINQYEKVNFHDFVNKYRVDEFIENASKNKEFTILAHAFDAGFNSKSSFNSVFKKHHGMTPSKYIAQFSK